MAKSKIPSSKEPGSFSKLNDLLNKIAPDGEMLDINPIAKIDEWISTGSYILNAALSGSLFGGLPNRRSLVLAGEEGTGKTFIAMSIVRNAQKMGYTPIYFDSEGAIDIEFVQKLGVDVSNIRLQPVNTVEEFSHIAAQITNNFEDLKAKGETPPKVMVVLDSLGNLTSEKEKEDTTKGDNKRDMTKQQAIRKLFRVNGMQFAKHGIPFIINNHVYDSMSMFSPKEVSGGGGVKYNASIIFMLGKGKLKDAEGEKEATKKNVEAVRVGVTIFVSPIKQRFARPIKVQFHIPFYKPINPFVGLEPFVNWESCGIVRGKLHDKKSYEKLTPSEKKNCFEWMMKDSKLDPETLHYVEARPTATTLVCKHLGGEIPLSELFTERVFTKEVLTELDETVIKPTFMLPSIESLEDLAEITKELENEGDTEEENQD
jgi:RecA/RadA recombinase